MTDSPINDLDDLLVAFGTDEIDGVASMIEKAASDVGDGRFVSIMDESDAAFTIVVGTIGAEIEFPTTVSEIVQTANDIEAQLLQLERQFRVIPGDPGSGVVLHVPHSSRRIPDQERHDILLDDEALERELDAMTDAFTDVIAERVADLCRARPWIFVNKLSRLVVDPERFPDETEEMNAVGMGAVYTRTSTGEPLRDEDPDAMESLRQTYFDPYAAELAAVVDERLQSVGPVMIIDLHSYPLEALPYELHGDGPRPEVCLGTDTFHTPPGLTDAARDAFSAFEIGLDSPFAGCYVPLAHYGTTERLHALMIELRRDLYMDDDHQLVGPAIEPIAQSIAALLDEVGPVAIVTCQGMGDALGDLPEIEEEA